LGEVVPFRPKQFAPSVPPRVYDTGPLTCDELLRVEELLLRPLPTVFTNGSASDEPMLPCPLTDVSWLEDDVS